MKNEESPNETNSTKLLRKDLSRILRMIEAFEERKDTRWGRLTEENSILRELLTSWQAVTAAEFMTAERHHLDSLTRRMCDTDE